MVKKKSSIKVTKDMQWMSEKEMRDDLGWTPYFGKNHVSNFENESVSLSTRNEDIQSSFVSHLVLYKYIVYNIKLTVYILFIFPLVICSTLQLDIHVFEPKVADCWGKTKLPEERCHAHQAVVVYMPVRYI